jgi:L-fuconolactonase
MLIVDAQVHIWAASTPERPWPARHHPHRPQPFSKDDLLREMDAAGVSRSIIVPPGWEGDRNDLGLEAARLHPDRFAVMGVLELQSPSARGQLARWRDQPGMLGVRIHLRRERRQWLSDGQIDWLWAEAEAAGVPLMLSVDPDQLSLIDAVASRHPRLKLVMDHLSLWAGQKDEAAFKDLDKLLALARHANIVAKASAMPGYTMDAYPFQPLHPHIRRVYDAFGPRRMLWGSDLTRMKCPYREVVTLFTECLPWLTAEDKEWIMGRAACEWLGWPLP